MAANRINGMNGNHEVSSVAEWYKNRSIFVTGATGFIGKSLVAKLLHSCPDLDRIYVLLRKKRNVAPEKRLEELKQSHVFDELKKSNPKRLDKLVAITGDIMEPELGISSREQQILIENVSVVFHSAATVKFDEALPLSVAINIMGARWMLKLGRMMNKLEAFVHVSTAYSNCDNKIIDEKIYPPPADITKVLDIIETFDRNKIDEMTPKLIGNRPNTYIFTKALAENVVLKEGVGMPVVIIRPSIVVAALKEPAPGWIDNINGPTGLIAAGGKGILRTLYCERKNRGDIIPVDINTNVMILAAWNTAKEKNYEMKVYHVTTGTDNPIRWGEMEKKTKELILKYPFNDVLWYPGGTFKSNKYYHKVCEVLLHFLPAYLIDFTNSLFGDKSKGSLVKVQTRIRKATEVLEYFFNNEWTFKSGNIKNLNAKLTEIDRSVFFIDVKKINWDSFMLNYVLGIKKYIMKDSDKDLEKAKSHLHKMYMIDLGTKILFIAILANLAFGNLDLARKFSGSVMFYVLQLLKKFTQNFA